MHSRAHGPHLRPSTNCDKLSEEVIPRGKEIEIPLPANQQVEIADGLHKSPSHLRRFLPFAAVKRDRLGIVSDVDETIPKIRLSFKLVEIDLHQASTNDHREHGPHHGIEQQHTG